MKKHGLTTPERREAGVIQKQAQLKNTPASASPQAPPRCGWCAIPLVNQKPTQSLCPRCRAWALAGSRIAQAAELLRGAL
jgi:hypothetical protein